MDLQLRFFLDGEHYVLVERKHAGPPELGFEELGPWETERLLQSALSQADVQGSLRAGICEDAAERGLQDHLVLTHRARTRLGEDPERFVLLRRLRPRVALSFLEPDIADLADLMPDDPDEDTWIEVRVIDEDDEPCAGIEYEIELSDGRIRRGRTNEHGILRYDGMPHGECKVRLVSVDAPSWDRA